MQAAQAADVFEGNLPSDSKLRYQIEHFEPDSVHQNRSRKFDGRRRQENESEKSNEKNGPQSKTDKNDIYQKDDNKAEKKKRDLSKLPHFGRKGVCWSCGEPKNANGGCKSLFHKKTVAVNSSSVELPPVSNADLCENPTVCRVDVALHNACDAAPAEFYESLKSKSVIESETQSNTGIQPAELIDVYHSSDKVYQSDMFDDLSDTFLSTFASMGSDPWQSGSDTVVGEVSDLFCKLSNLVDVKPLSYVPIQLQGHNQSYSCLSDSGCMISIIKQSVLENGSKPDMSSVDNLGPVRVRSAFGQSVLAHLVRLDVRLGCHSSESPFLPVTFAVVKDLTEDVILPEVTVKELSEYGKMREINTVDVDTSVNENVDDKHLNHDSNEDRSHKETNGQTDDEPVVNTGSNQDTGDSESI